MQTESMPDSVSTSASQPSITDAIQQEIKTEDRIIELLAQVWELYQQLSELHPWDKDTFSRSIHTAQAIVLSRPKVRGIKIAQGNLPRDAFAKVSPSLFSGPPPSPASSTVSGPMTPIAPVGTGTPPRKSVLPF